MISFLQLEDKDKLKRGVAHGLQVEDRDLEIRENYKLGQAAHMMQ